MYDQMEEQWNEMNDSIYADPPQEYLEPVPIIQTTQPPMIPERLPPEWPPPTWA